MGEKTHIFDGALGIARQVQRRLAGAQLLNDAEGAGEILWQNSSPDVRLLALGKKLLAIK